MHCRNWALILVAMAALARPTDTSAEVPTWPHELVSGPFRFHATFPLTRYQSLFDELARLPDEVTSAIRIDPPREMVDVYLFPNRAIYQMYMRRYFPNVVTRRAMYIKVAGPGNVFAYVDAGFDVDLRHECTHAILHASLPMVPLWLDEGLAEYFEVPASQRATQNPHHADIKRYLAWHGAPSLEELEGVRSLEGMGNDEYRNAWAWVHLMMHGPPAARSMLLALMADLNQHVPPLPISARFARVHVDAEELFTLHFVGRKPRLFRLPQPR